MGKLTEIATYITRRASEYMPTSEIIATYPEGITIDGIVERASKKFKSDTIAFTFSEDYTKYSYAGVDSLKKIFDGFLMYYDNDMELLKKAFRKEHIRIRLYKKPGEEYTHVEILGAVEVDNDEPAQLEAWRW